MTDGLQLTADSRPEPAIAELAAAGAVLVSVTPAKTTLEDVFISAIHGPGQSATPENGRPEHEMAIQG